MKLSTLVQTDKSETFGLPQRTLDALQTLLGGFKKIDKALVYGSRAMSRHHAGSDIDITLIGEDLGLEDLERIAGALDESAIPYKVDLSILKYIDHPDLKAHIARVGKVLFEKSVP